MCLSLCVCVCARARRVNRVSCVSKTRVNTEKLIFFFFFFWIQRVQFTLIVLKFWNLKHSQKQQCNRKSAVDLCSFVWQIMNTCKMLVLPANTQKIYYRRCMLRPLSIKTRFTCIYQLSLETILFLQILKRLHVSTDCMIMALLVGLHNNAFIKSSSNNYRQNEGQSTLLPASVITNDR